MDNLVQAALGVLAGKCEPKSVNKNKTEECELQSENTEGDNGCSAGLTVEAEDRFNSVTAPAVKKIDQTVAAAKKELAEEKGWLDTVLTSFQNLPSEAQSQLVEAGKNLRATAKCIGDSCTLIVKNVSEQVKAIAPPCVVKVVETASEALSSIGTSIGSFLPGYSSLSSLWDKACSFGKSIWHSCVSFFDQFTCKERKEQERQIEEDRKFQEELDQKLQNAKKVARNQVETKRLEKVAQVKREIQAKEIEKNAIQNKRAIQLIETHPIAIAIDDLQARLLTACTEYSEKVAKLAVSNDVWGDAPDILGTIAMINGISHELNSKQKAYENQCANFNKTTERLNKLRLLV